MCHYDENHVNLVAWQWIGAGGMPLGIQHRNGKLSICMNFLFWQAGSILWKFYWKKLDICRLRCHDRETDLKVLSRLFEEMFSPTKKQPRNSTRILAKHLWQLGDINVTIIQETNTTRFSSKIVNEDYFVYHLGFRTLKVWFQKILGKMSQGFQLCIFLSQPYSERSPSKVSCGLVRTGGLNWKHIPRMQLIIRPEWFYHTWP